MPFHVAGRPNCSFDLESRETPVYYGWKCLIYVSFWMTPRKNWETVIQARAEKWKFVLKKLISK
jgi:hypothetical protein